MAVKKKGRVRGPEPDAVIPKKEEKPENVTIVPAKPRRRAEIARTELREYLWGSEADQFMWHRLKETGFTTIPRTLMLIATLIKELTKQGDASRVYLDLWARAYDEGIVEVFDESEFALSSGYSPGRRTVRTWRERIKELQRLNFIAVRPKPGRDIGFILLLHPHGIVLHLSRKSPERIPDWWWQLYQNRLREIRAVLPRIGDLEDFLEVANGPLPKDPYA